VAATVCVTGGLGFLGSRLCTALADEGYKVVCVDELSADYAPGAGHDAAETLATRPGVDVVVQGLNHAQLERVLPRADAIIHLAALPGVRSRHSFSELWQENVLLTERLVAHAARRGVRMVFASSSSVYGDAVVQPTPEDAAPAPLSAYATSKLAAENACLAAAHRQRADVTIVRLFTVFGPGQRPDMAIARWTEAIRGGVPITWHVHPGGARELTHVDDAVRGLIAALERGRPGEAYNLGGCGSHRLEEVLGIIEQQLGLRARMVRTNPPALDPVRTEACQCKSALELGYRPAIALEEGIRSQLRASAARPRDWTCPRAPTARRLTRVLARLPQQT
jgi:UDP-glucuronate 4-epimerase